MASTEFPENEREEGDPTMAEEQPTQKDLSTEYMWDINRKLIYASEHYDQRIENLNQKTVADAQAQAVFWQNITERNLSLKLASQELLERQQQFWATMRERQDQHADQRAHVATLGSVDYANARNGVLVNNEVAMKHNILAARAVEPKETLDTISEQIGNASAAGASAVAQGIESIARAQTDRTQTSAANVAELSAARQVADVNVLNTLSQIVGIMNTAQAANQALANQVAELTGVVQALMASQKTLAA
jgi:hypothetical protein